MPSFLRYPRCAATRGALSPYEPLLFQEYSIPVTLWAKVHCRRLPKGYPQLPAVKLQTLPLLAPV
jgi:hypothetical protein